MNSVRAILLLSSALASSYAIADPPSKAVLLRTGQTTCWDSGGNATPCAGTGQDGEVQAGVAFGFVDNGNGTITETTTNLTWEKKSKDGSFNDFRLAYTWDDAFRVHIATLNAQRFGGHDDWRLPNIRELQTLVNLDQAAADSVAFYPQFNSPDCVEANGYVTVLTGSCTAFGGWYWSSTTAPKDRESAWSVDVQQGLSQKIGKMSSFANFVRAVRGGINTRKK